MPIEIKVKEPTSNQLEEMGKLMPSPKIENLDEETSYIQRRLDESKHGAIILEIDGLLSQFTAPDKVDPVILQLTRLGIPVESVKNYSSKEEKTTIFVRRHDRKT